MVLLCVYYILYYYTRRRDVITRRHHRRRENHHARILSHRMPQRLSIALKIPTEGLRRRSNLASVSPWILVAEYIVLDEIRIHYILYIIIYYPCTADFIA